MSAPPSFLGQLFTRKLFAFAGGSLLIYDYFLTLSLEVTHIWNEPWSLVKFLFLINRYGNLVGQTFILLEESGYVSHGSRSFCVAFLLISPFYAVFSGESIRLFVLMRTCAVFGCERRLALAVTAVYILYAIAILAFVTSELATHINNIQFQFLDEVGVCIGPLVPYPELWLLWFMPLILDACMLAIICYGFWRSTRETRGISTSPLLRLLLRDGFLFYVAALFNVVFAMVCWTVYGRDPRNFLQELISYPLLSAVGQRLVLNLREHRMGSNSTFDTSRRLSRQVAAAFEEQSRGSDDSFEMIDLTPR